MRERVAVAVSRRPRHGERARCREHGTLGRGGDRHGRRGAADRHQADLAPGPVVEDRHTVGLRRKRHRDGEPERRPLVTGLLGVQGARRERGVGELRGTVVDLDVVRTGLRLRGRRTGQDLPHGNVCGPVDGVDGAGDVGATAGQGLGIAEGPHHEAVDVLVGVVRHPPRPAVGHQVAGRPGRQELQRRTVETEVPVAGQGEHVATERADRDQPPAARVGRVGGRVGADSTAGGGVLTPEHVDVLVHRGVLGFGSRPSGLHLARDVGAPVGGRAGVGPRTVRLGRYEPVEQGVVVEVEGAAQHLELLQDGPAVAAGSGGDRWLHDAQRHRRVADVEARRGQQPAHPVTEQVERLGVGDGDRVAGEVGVDDQDLHRRRRPEVHGGRRDLVVAVTGLGDALIAVHRRLEAQPTGVGPAGWDGEDERVLRVGGAGMLADRGRRPHRVDGAEEASRSVAAQLRLDVEHVPGVGVGSHDRVGLLVGHEQVEVLLVLHDLGDDDPLGGDVHVADRGQQEPVQHPVVGSLSHDLTAVVDVERGVQRPAAVGGDQVGQVLHGRPVALVDEGAAGREAAHQVGVRHRGAVGADDAAGVVDPVGRALAPARAREVSLREGAQRLVDQGEALALPAVRLYRTAAEGLRHPRDVAPGVDGEHAGDRVAGRGEVVGGVGARMGRVGDALQRHRPDGARREVGSAHQPLTDERAAGVDPQSRAALEAGHLAAVVVQAVPTPCRRPDRRHCGA